MDGRLVQLSKAMSWLLRHGAADAGVNMDPEGYVLWDEMCGLKQFKGFSVEDVLLVVEHNSKKRFDWSAAPLDLGVWVCSAHNAH